MAYRAVKLIAGPWGAYRERELIDASVDAATIKAWLDDGAIVEVPDQPVVRDADGSVVQEPGGLTHDGWLGREPGAIVPQPDGTAVHPDGTKVGTNAGSGQVRFDPGNTEHVAPAEHVGTSWTPAEAAAIQAAAPGAEPAHEPAPASSATAAPAPAAPFVPEGGEHAISGDGSSDPAPATDGEAR